MRASRAPLIVLTGGPGCGKTFATKAIVQLWQSQQKDVRLAAPTGPSRPSHERPQAAFPPKVSPIGCGTLTPQYVWLFAPTSPCFSSLSLTMARALLAMRSTPLSAWLLSMTSRERACRQSGRAAAGGGQRQEHQGHHHPPPPQLQVLVSAPPRHRQGVCRGQAVTRISTPHRYPQLSQWTGGGVARSMTCWQARLQVRLLTGHHYSTNIPQAFLSKPFQSLSPCLSKGSEGGHIRTHDLRGCKRTVVCRRAVAFSSLKRFLSFASFPDAKVHSADK